MPSEKEFCGIAAKQELSYDAWGRLRNPATQTAYTPGSEPALFLGRGYTGHEYMPWFGLINANARLYDPALGRFLSPDPYMQMPDFSQNFNRYSYCLNNPLVYVDEDGEFWHIVIGAIIGGVGNLIANWNHSSGFWEHFTSFLVGAGAGAATATTGGAAGATWAGIAGVSAAGSAVVGTTNSVIAQTGTNFEGFNKVDWGLAAQSGAIGGVAGFAGGSAGYWAANASTLVNNVSSPVLRSAIVSPLAAGAGHVAGGTTANLFAGQNLGDAFANSFSGIGSSMIVGGAMGIASTVAVSYANNVNPWTGKYNKPLYHYTTKENADLIMKSQLGFDKNSNVYLTPDGTKTPIQAQIDLALPQSNTAESLIQLKPNSIYPKNMLIQRNVTGNVYMRGGGGFEIIYKGSINTEYLFRVK